MDNLTVLQVHSSIQNTLWSTVSSHTSLSGPQHGLFTATRLTSCPLGPDYWTVSVPKLNKPYYLLIKTVSDHKKNSNKGFSFHFWDLAARDPSSLHFLPWTTFAWEHCTRAAVPEMLWPIRLAAIICPMSESLKSFYLLNCPASYMYFEDRMFTCCLTHPPTDWSRGNKITSYSLYLSVVIMLWLMAVHGAGALKCHCCENMVWVSLESFCVVCTLK